MTYEIAGFCMSLISSVCILCVSCYLVVTVNSTTRRIENHAARCDDRRDEIEDHIRRVLARQDRHSDMLKILTEDAL